MHIRHNSKLKTTKILSYKTIKKEDSEDYIFIKDGEESEGKQNILKVIFQLLMYMNLKKLNQNMRIYFMF